MDGMFIKMQKPKIHGDSYWCYKQFTDMLILACVNARGVFTYLHAGNLGKVGDATTFKTSWLPDKISRRKWLGSHSAIVDEVEFSPYLVWNDAFALSPNMLKCHPDPVNEEHQKAFNYRLMPTHRVVKQAFGRLKGRFHIIDKNALSKPTHYRRCT